MMVALALMGVARSDVMRMTMRELLGYFEVYRKYKDALETAFATKQMMRVW